MVADVPVTGTGHDDAVAGKLAAILRRLERNGHLRPFVERCRAAELDAVFVDGHLVRRERQSRLPAGDAYWVFRRTKASDLFSTHK